jgi:hypothetical protein
MSETATGPHTFRPLRWWDALRSNGRCAHCYIPRSAHPVHGWIRARPLGDKRKAELTFEAMSDA